MTIVRRAGGSKIPPGEKIRVKVKKAVEDEGNHGPQLKLDLETLGPKKFKGIEFPEWAKVAEDEETGEKFVAEGGKLDNIITAALVGDEEKISSLNSIPQVAKTLKGKTFSSITTTRGKDNQYFGLTWNMIFVDTDAHPEQSFEPGDDLPDDDDTETDEMAADENNPLIWDDTDAA